MFVAKQTFGYEQTPLTSWRNTKKKKKNYEDIKRPTVAEKNLSIMEYKRNVVKSNSGKKSNTKYKFFLVYRYFLYSIA